MTANTTPLGALLEYARAEVLHISGREAARRAGISDAHWRHTIAGVQYKRGKRVEIRPTVRTVIAMATAVGVDPLIALKTAELDVSRDAVDAILHDLTRPAPASRVDMTDEIDRIRRATNLTPDTRRAAILALVDLYAEDAP